MWSQKWWAANLWLRGGSGLEKELEIQALFLLNFGFKKVKSGPDHINMSALN